MFPQIGKAFVGWADLKGSVTDEYNIIGSISLYMI